MFSFKYFRRRQIDLRRMTQVDETKGVPNIEIRTFHDESDVPLKRVRNSPTHSGSYGSVTKRKDLRGNVYAVKDIRIVTSTTTDNSDRNSHLLVEKEIKLLSRCDHKNLLKFIVAYKVTLIKDSIFIVTEPWADHSLREYLISACKSMATTPLKGWTAGNASQKCCHFFTGLLDGLAYLHEHNIVHKDIKPENVLIHQGIPIIADFGMSKLWFTGQTTQFTKSTQQYLAPEQIAHHESGPKADVFQLGCCFLLIAAASIAGTQGIDDIDDVVVEIPHTTIYANEMFHVLAVLRRLVEEERHSDPSVLLWIFVAREMVLEDPSRRIGAQQLSKQLQPPRVGHHLQDYDVWQRLKEEFCSPCEPMLNHFLAKGLDVQPTSSPQNSSLMNQMAIMGPLGYEYTKVWATLDTGSELNLISASFATQYTKDTNCEASVLVNSLQLAGLSGNAVFVKASLKLNFTLGPREEPFSAEFFILPALDVHFDVLLGRHILAKVFRYKNLIPKVF